MTNVREVTKLTCITVCVYISILTQVAYFVSLFEQVSIHCFQGIDFADTCVFITRYSNADASSGYTFYPLSYLQL